MESRTRPVPTAGLRVAFVLACAALFVPPLSAAVEKPNVLIVLTDDQGMGDFSCYGNPVLKTPHLDTLRGQCVRLTDFHVAPMCTPTRGQLLTGQDAVRNGATSVTGGRSFIRPGIPTMPEMFVASGYRTGIFGKWHLGDNYPHRPIDRGFQEAVHILGWGFTSAPEFSNKLFDGRCQHNGKQENFTGYCTDVWFARAMDWMKQQQAAGQPFFCYLPLNAPHAPHDVARKYSAPYEQSGPAGFFGMIANIDENIARLETFLADSGLRENTILVFMTDNGGTAGVRVWNAGLREGKTTFWDGGHRVPCWIRWPKGGLGEPRDIAAATQIQDLLPTLLEWCDVKPPADARFDGSSLSRLLRGEIKELPDRKFVVQYSRAKLSKWECAVVWNRWRLVKGEELYDSEADRAQRNNLASKHPEIVAAMREHYEKWWQGLAPVRGKFVTTHLGSAKQPEVALTSSDWQDVYADNAGHVRQAAGGPRGGHWNVEVEREGDYVVSLRRWPVDLDLPIASRPRGGGRAIQAANAKLVVAGRELSSPVKPDDKQVVFRTRLPAGPTTLQAWFTGRDGTDLCGAFYVNVTSVVDDN